MILTSAITSIDTIALFLEKNWLVVLISVIVSAAFLFILIKKSAVIGVYGEGFDKIKGKIKKKNEEDNEEELKGK